jgi:hypothetical protein
MKIYAAAAIIVVMASAVIGCAGKPVTWRAAPATVNASVADAQVTLAPLRQGNPFYSAFRLTVFNNGKTALDVDWNGSEYQINDMAGGALWFDGITAQAIREKSVPADTVAPGDTLSRVVAPIQLIAIAPLKASTRKTPAFSAGQLPAGKNSIRLVLIRGNKAHRVVLPVTITADETQ